MPITDGGVSKQFVFTKLYGPLIIKWKHGKSYLSHVSEAPVQAVAQQPPFLKIHDKYFSCYFKDDTE